MQNLYRHINFPQKTLHGIVEVNESYISYKNNCWCIISQDVKQPPERTGWKFHVAIDEQDLEKGFNIIADIAIKNKCHIFKVLKANCSLPDSQAGKTVVLYDYGTENWHEILPQIERALHQKGVHPHQALNNPYNNLNKDRRVCGSAYIMYGNDQNATGKYMPAEARQTYNDTGKPDPFYELTVSSTDRPGKLPESGKPISEQCVQARWQTFSNWQHATTQDGTPIARLPVNDFKDHEIIHLQNQLAQFGLQTTCRISQTLGKTVRLTGAENMTRLSNILNLRAQNKVYATVPTCRNHRGGR